MHPDALHLFQELADRSPAEREAYYVAHHVDAGLRAEVESLLRFDGPAADSLADYVASAAADVLRERPHSDRDRREEPARPDTPRAGSMTAPLTGRRFGVFEVQDLIGAGGMGEVYRARDTRLGRDVAIKIVPRAFQEDRERLMRFEREARVLASLNHPHIGVVYGLEETEGLKALVMELVEGENLAERLAEGPLPVNEALEIARQVAAALEAAHAQGIVHRDLKPANVKRRPDGEVKVLDFGLAKPLGWSSDSMAATQSGVIGGTPAYMSPEQARGDAVDGQADIWSFGVMLFELLTGVAPFARQSTAETLAAVFSAGPDYTLLPTPTPASVQQLIRRCLEKDRRRRLKHIGDARLELEEAISTGRDSAPPSAQPGRLADAAGRSTSNVSRRMQIVMVCALAAVAAAAGWTFWRDRTPQRPALPQAASPVAARGIAVLPFENIGTADDAYFAAGVTEEVTLQLAKISALRVINRSAVARFKGGAAELPAMARDLRIGAVLTGSVRHAGDRVRVGVQLLAAPTGETLWADQYDRDIKDIFRVQTDVAIRVARSLQASLAPNERARIERAPTENTEAYDLYLKARPLRAAIATDNAEGLRLLKRAVELDPAFALAHSALAWRYYFQSWTSGSEDRQRSIEAARKAVSLDPHLARGHHALSLALRALGQIDEARLAMQRAVELDPNFWNAIEDLSLLEASAGRLDQAAYWAARGLPLAPNLAYSYYHVGIPLILLDDVSAERVLRAASERFPANDPTGGQRLQILLAIIALRRGERDAALARIRSAVAAEPQNAEGQRLLTEIAALTEAPDARARVDKSLETAPDVRGGWVTPYTARTLRAFLWEREGDGRRSRALVDAAIAANGRAIESGDRSDAPFYENAALHLMRGDRTAALTWLDRAERAGLKDAEFLVRDPLLAPLAAEPKFLEIVARIRTAVAEMRQRVDLRGLDDWARGG